ncbi:hypothetical protein CPC08DRAFT_343334 [Agrocybe pediades]|nr:hypothetical protein CPC08DRAFT_343334 [Agrocybe pediades]
MSRLTIKQRPTKHSLLPRVSYDIKATPIVCQTTLTTMSLPLQDDTDLVLSKNSSPSCTVESLPPELLLKIFIKNTELDDPSHNRLHTAHWSSQVSRLWRALLLGSPSVWGRLLELTYYERAGDNWREEVLSRVGNALLWITGSVTESIAPFLFSVLDKKWKRVQILEIAFRRSQSDDFQAEMWPFLCSEALGLESISLEYFHGQPPSGTSSANLFNGIAPRLRNFRISPSFHFDVNAQWLSTLCGLSLSCDTIPVVASILKATPLLRCLKLSGDLVEDQDTTFMDHTVLDIPPLPYLERLEISGCHAYLIVLLESIHLPSRRQALHRLSIDSCRHAHNNPPPEVLERMRRAFTRWIQAYMDDFPPQYMHLFEHRVHNHDSVTIVDPRWTPNDGFQLMLGRGHPFISIFGASSIFSAITQLRLRPGPQPDLWVPLYKAFHSVVELSIHGTWIKGILNVVNQFSLFPSLRTLQCDRIAMAPFPRMLDFLEHRASIGLPLSVLYLTSADIGRLSDAHRDRLDKITGLSLRETL